ncbi:MAG: N-acetylmuramoyl-L-alanine amidase [Saprospiraceae bacterium]
MIPMNRILSLFLILASITSVKASEYFSVTVEKGDNLTLLLKKYHLNVNTCNLELFLNINKIKNEQILIANRKYYIPVKIYRFDGKTIRSTIGISDYNLAKKIEDYNIELHKAGVRQTHYKQSNILWVPDEYISCEGSSAPSTENESKPDTSVVSKGNDENNSTTTDNGFSGKSSFKNTGINMKRVPLMGKSFEEVWIEDYSLKNQVFYIISGHGGPDPGAVYKKDGETFCEDEYAYDVALRLARNLMQHGAIVHMVVQDERDGIRDEKYLPCDCTEKLHNGAKIPRSQKERLRQRVSSVNSLYEKYKKQGYKHQKAIEIHVDSRNASLRQDVFFYFNKNDKDGKKLAENVHKVFERKYDIHQKNRGYHGFIEDRNIYMVRNLRPTTLFIELANIRNPKDQERLVHYYNRQALANWLFEGLRTQL